jgi:probable phosphoglycerate mutase
LSHTLLLLIRHAKNDWVGERLPGQTPGIHLSEEGREEAAVLAGRMADYPLDALYASTLERAQETAAILAKPHGLPVGDLPDLVDLDTGDLTGMSIKEAQKQPVWIGIQAFPSITRIPGGESLWDLQVRVVRALEGVRRRHEGGVVAVVAHSDVIKVAVAHYVGLPLDLFQRLVISTTSVSLLLFTDHGARLVTMNNTAELPRPEPPSEDSGSGEGSDDAAHATDVAGPEATEPHA